MSTEAIDALVQEGEAILADLETLKGKAAEAATDEEKKGTLEAVKVKETEWEALQGKIAEAKVTAKREEVLAEAKRLRTVPVQGKVAIEGKERPVENFENEAKGKVDGFWKYVHGDALSDRERDLCAPKSDSFEAGKDAILMPPSMAADIMGKRFGFAQQSEAGAQMKALSEAIQAEGFKDGDVIPAKRFKEIAGKVIISSNAADASLIPQEYIKQILQLPGEPHNILGMCTVVPSETGTLTIPRLVQTAANEYGGVAFQWTTEGDNKPETEPVWEQIEIDCFELSGYTEITNTMLRRSAFALQPYLTALYKDAMQHQIGVAILTGSGVAQPLGLVNAAGINLVARQVANQVNWQDLVNLEHAVRAYHRTNARFVVDDTAMQNMKLRVDTANRPLFTPGVAGNMYDRLLNYPYLDTHRTPNLGNSGDVIFGNWSWYWVAMEAEIAVKITSEGRNLVRQNKTGMAIYVVFGGRPVEPRVFSILSGVGS